MFPVTQRRNKQPSKEEEIVWDKIICNKKFLRVFEIQPQHLREHRKTEGRKEKCPKGTQLCGNLSF